MNMATKAIRLSTPRSGQIRMARSAGRRPLWLSPLSIQNGASITIETNESTTNAVTRDFPDGSPSRELLHGCRGADLDRPSLVVRRQQLKRGDWIGLLLLQKVTELRSDRWQARLISAQRGENQLLIGEANPTQTQQTFQEARQFDARGSGSYQPA
jgi:hypothetical protein